MPNFMLEDVAGCLKEIGVFPLFIVTPGYAIAWLGDLFEFRRRTAAFRMALSVPLSIAICPIVTHLLGRFLGMGAVWIFYAAAAFAFLGAIVRTPRGLKFPKDIRVFTVAVGIWLVVALGSLIDLQIGDRLYYPASALDNSVRSAFVHSISTTGIPPDNPLFLPGRPAPLRYHYFWLMMCSLAELAGRGATARQALTAGTFWCGVGLMALIAMYLRLFLPADPARLRRRILAAFVLLGITGLDIIPTLFFLLLHLRGAMPLVMPSVEWWNEHVDWFLYTTLWAPHALSSLLACCTGFLLLWKAPAEDRRGLVVYSLLGGAALASSVGASIYVAFVFAAFLAVWTAIAVMKKWRRESGVLAMAAITAIVLVTPYLLGLGGGVPAGPGSSGGIPLQFTVRTFSLAALVPGWFRLGSTARLLLINLPLLPINYLLEFGFFFAVAVIQWRRWRSSGAPLTRGQLALVTMAATSALICTFVRSSVIGCNDLGWRGFLVAQFVLLLAGTDLVAGDWHFELVSNEQRRLLGFFFMLGAIGVAYDLTLTRVYPILADRGVAPPIDWMSPDRHFGRRTYAARAAYEWAQRWTTETATIQFNPKVAFQDTTAMLYSDRRTVAADLSCNATFGGDARLCAGLIAQLQKLYPAAGAASPGIQDVCSSLPIDLVIAKDTDQVWSDRQSWVWKERPVFRNRYIRMFACGPKYLSRR